MHDLLVRPMSAAMTPAIIGNAFYFRARELGLITNKGFVEGRFLRLVNGVCENTPSAIAIVGNRPSANWMARGLRTRNIMNNYAKNIFAIALLFESIEAFRDAVERYSTAEGRCAQLISGPTPSHDEILRHRERLMEYLRTFPNATRSDVRSKLGYVAMKLRTFDSDWYDKVLPPRRDFLGMVQAKRALITSRRDDLDANAAAWIERRYRAEMSTDARPTRLKRTTLLRGAPGAQTVAASPKERYPLANALLMLYVESKESFLLRKAKWLLTNGKHKTSPRSKIGFAAHRTRLSYDVIEQLATVLRVT